MTDQPAHEPRKFNHIGFHQYLAEGRLMGARCSACGAVFLPPRPMCPQCYGTAREWVELSGEGKVTGYTTIYVGLPAMAAEGYSRQNPYCSGVVHLEEGPVITAQILGAGGGFPGDIQVGMPVRAVFRERGESGHASLAFTPE